jgi:hypothetical protein
MKGLIFTVIILIAIGLGGRYLFEKYSKGPSERTIQLANLIEKYPQSRSWQIKENRNLCFFATDSCNQSVKIKFSSNTPSWSSVYSHFITYMQENGWETRSIVVTRIPDSATFTNHSCSAYLIKESLGFLGLGKDDNGRYSLTITCN